MSVVFRAITLSLAAVVLHQAALPCAAQVAPPPIPTLYLTPPPPSPRFSELLNMAGAVLIGRALQSSENQLFSDIAVDEVLKEDVFIKGKKTLTTNRIYGADSPLLLFLHTSAEGISPLQRYYITDARAVKEYVAGLARCQTTAERLRHCFDFLNSAESHLADDAHREYAAATTKDLLAAAKTLPAEKIAARLRAAGTPYEDVQLYGLLLGGAGTAEHGQLLRSVIGTSVKQHDNIARLLKGWMMLQPKECRRYLHSLLADGTQPFELRSSALQAADFGLFERPDLIDSKELIASVVMLLDQPDVADHAIFLLRRARAWEHTDLVLARHTVKKDTKNNNISRHVIMFALQSPTPACAAFVAERRKDAPDDVLYAERMLDTAERMLEALRPQEK